MASGKQYKNVYTILEKVKKGEMDGHYKTKDGLFGKMDFYKKPDLISPHLHYLDERRLENIVDTYITNAGSKTVKDYYAKFSAHSQFKKLDDAKKPDFAAFSKKVVEKYNKFPKHMMRDIFKMYYNRMENLEFEERTDKTHTKFKFLEKANNPVGKIMTESSSLKSSMFTRSIMMYYMMQMAAMEYTDPETAEKIQNAMNGKGSEFDQKDLDDAVNKMFDNKMSKDQLEKAMEEAQQMCQNMDDNLSDDIQQKMFDEANKSGGDIAGKLSPDYMRQIAEKLQKINMSMGSLKDKIKKLLDKSTSYFSSREVVKYEDLFNSDNLAGLDDFVFLHPALRKIMAEDVQIKDVKYIGKIDVYIDVSGSMSSDSGVDRQGGQYISKLDFCKSFTAKLLEMDMLNDVYLFDTRVKKYQNDLVSISMIDCGGGTTIDAAVMSVERNNNNAIIITDAEDRCSIYSSKAFFIGIKGARFDSFNSNVIEKYSDNAQVVVFDGIKVHRVNNKGLTV
jgi:predicted transcriptional regulator